MKRTAILVAALLTGASAAYADYASGLEAYIRGDYRTAFAEFQPLAQQGDARAQFRLGELYAEGRGVPQDFIQAYRWLSLAAAQGVQEAARARDTVASRMTPQQIAEAQALTAATRSGPTAEPGLVSPPLTGQAGVPASTGGITDQAVVAGIQRELNRLGFDAGPVDAIMGSRTRQAIRDYQRAAGMPVTGEPSASLLARLRATEPAQVRTVQQPQQQPQQQQPAVTDRRALVREIQRELARLGFEPGPVDGVLGPRTRQAIIDFRQAAGLPVSAEVSQDLLDRLRTTTADITTATELTRDEQQLPEAFISEIERELLSRGYNVGRVDGDVDAQLRQAIRQYQRDAGLQVTGQVSQALLDHLKFARPRITAG